MNFAFREWFSGLSEEQQKSFYPLKLDENTNLENSRILEETAKNHFQKEIWPEKKKEIIEQEKKLEEISVLDKQAQNKQE
jgi:hypothetical protein